MTVADNNAFEDAVVIAEGVTQFNYSFDASEASDVQVQIIDQTTGALTYLTYSTDYTVTPVALPAVGGVVDVTASLTTGDSLVVFRSTKRSQDTNLVNQGPFHAETIEAELDRLSMLLQEVYADINRALKIPKGVGGDGDIAGIQPLWVPRMNAAGTGFEGVELDLASIAASIAAAAASAAAAATSESNASDYADDAAAQVTLAANQVTLAAAQVALAEAAFDEFDDRYLGAKASNPTVDNDGEPLQVGTIYWNSTERQMRTWNGTSWSELAGGGGIVWRRETTTTTAVENEGIWSDTAGGAWTGTLPNSPAEFAVVQFRDPNTKDDANNWETDNFTVDPDGATIDGVAGNYVCDLAGGNIEFQYVNGTWKTTIFGPISTPASLITTYKYTATASQTVFTGLDDGGTTMSFNSAGIFVTLNGVMLEEGADFTTSGGDTITLTTGAAVDDEVNIYAFKSFDFVNFDAINGHIIPNLDSASDLGSTLKRFANIFADLVNAPSIITTDLTTTNINGAPPFVAADQNAVLLQTIEASNTAAVEFVTNIDATFDEYLVKFIGVVGSTDGGRLLFRVSNDAGVSWVNSAGDYGFRGYYGYSTTASHGNVISAYTELDMNYGVNAGGAAYESQSGYLRIFEPAQSDRYQHGEWLCTGSYTDSNHGSTRGEFTIQSALAAINGLQFFFNGGRNISGKFKLYGVR